MAGEVIYRLDPLDVPAPDATLADAVQCGALALLCQRAAAADRHFRLDDATSAPHRPVPAARWPAARDRDGGGAHRDPRPAGGARAAGPAPSPARRSAREPGPPSHAAQHLRLEPCAAVGVREGRVPAARTVPRRVHRVDGAAGHGRCRCHRHSARRSPGAGSARRADRQVAGAPQRRRAGSILPVRERAQLCGRAARGGRRGAGAAQRHAEVVSRFVAAAAAGLRAPARRAMGRHLRVRAAQRARRARMGLRGRRARHAGPARRGAGVDRLVRPVAGRDRPVRHSDAGARTRRAGPARGRLARVQLGPLHRRQPRDRHRARAACAERLRSLGDTAGEYRALAQLARLYESRPSTLDDAKRAWEALQQSTPATCPCAHA